jgi:hypothetical protein
VEITFTSSHAVFKNFFVNIGIKRLNSFTPKSRGNRHAVFKNFFVNYEINLLKYEHNFNTAKKLAGLHG